MAVQFAAMEKWLWPGHNLRSLGIFLSVRDRNSNKITRLSPQVRASGLLCHLALYLHSLLSQRVNFHACVKGQRGKETDFNLWHHSMIPLKNMCNVVDPQIKMGIQKVKRLYATESHTLKVMWLQQHVWHLYRWHEHTNRHCHVHTHLHGGQIRVSG